MVTFVLRHYQHIAIVQLLPFQIASSYKSYKSFIDKAHPIAYPSLALNAEIYFANGVSVIRDAFFVENQNHFMGVVINSQIITNVEQAQDVVGELFLQIKTNPKFNVFKNKGHLMAYCRNYCKNLLKSEMGRQRYETLTPGAGIDMLDDNEETTNNDRLSDIVKSRLHLLTDRQKQIFKLQFIDGYSNLEVANKLEIGVNTVCDSISLSITKIRKSFGLEKISRSTKKMAINQYSLSGELIATYDSMTDAFNQTGINTGVISDVCAYRTDTAGGFLWELA